MKKMTSLALLIITLLTFMPRVALAIEPEVESLPPPSLLIYAVNPGYNVDGINNTGEFIELINLSGEILSLADFSLSYTNSSGTVVTILTFPKDSYLDGERLLLRLASSPQSELADLNYTTTLAFKAGPLELKQNDKIIDSVCWSGKDGCYKEFKSSQPTTLVREDDTFIHRDNYEPFFEKSNRYQDLTKEETNIPKEAEETKAPQCYELHFSEILSYYETSNTEQFIEFYNPTSTGVSMDGCRLRYKNKDYDLTGYINADSYFAFYPSFNLTKDPSSSNRLELIDTDGKVADTLIYNHGQKKGTAYAQFDYNANEEEQWLITYSPTPGEANNYQPYRTCPEDKIINEATGNCVKITTASTKICPEGKYLNPVTGRCKAYEETNVKTCAEGYELNPLTNRCRKIVQNNGADYAIEAEDYETRTSFIALYAIIGIAIVGMGYLVYEFRKEIGRIWHKFKSRFDKK